MFDEAGLGSPDHLLSHLKEKYYVPTLLAHVLKSAGAGDAWYWAAFKGPNGQAQIPRMLEDRKPYVRWIKKYLKARLIDGRAKA